MDRRRFLSGIALDVFAPALAAESPPTGKAARIGILGMRSPAVPNPLTEALTQGFRELGYVEGRRFVEAGGLMSCGPNVTEVVRRASVYVDSILNGVRPADLPLEQPTKVDLVVNLKAAKTLGVTIPQAFLLRADEGIQ